MIFRTTHFTVKLTYAISSMSAPDFFFTKIYFFLTPKGVLADAMYLETSVKSEAYGSSMLDAWEQNRNEEYISKAGWYFKTVAAQIPGKNDNVKLSKKSIGDVLH